MSDDQIILPRVADVLAPGIQSLQQSRPNSRDPVSGQLRPAYGNVFAGLRGQASLSLSRVADLVSNGLLDSATGDALAELCASEFDAVLNGDSQTATGYIYCSRPTSRPQGTIPKGTQFIRPATTSNLGGNVITLPSVTYESTAPVVVLNHAIHFIIPIAATTPGSAANTPILFTSGDAYPTGLKTPIPLFDPTITLTEYAMGGGSDGVTDAIRRRYAKAYDVGRYGPTLDSLKAGIFQVGTVRSAVFVEDTTMARTIIYAADSSWASSPQWLGKLQQSLVDNRWLGAGCRIIIGHVRNYLSTVTAVVRLRDSKYLFDTSEISDNVTAAVRAYYDDRLDFNIWSGAGLKAAIAASDRRILNCTSATLMSSGGVDITDGLAGGQYLNPDGPETGDIIRAEYGTVHAYLADNAVNATFIGPT